MSMFSSIVRTSVLGLVLVSVGGLGGCANGGGSGSAMSTLGVPAERKLVDYKGNTYSASELEPLGGTMTLNGVTYHSFAKKKGFWDRVGDGALRTGGSLAGGLGGAYAGKAIGGGPIGTSVGAVGGSTVGTEVVNGVTGAGDPNIVWVSAQQLNPEQPASLATAK